MNYYDAMGIIDTIAKKVAGDVPARRRRAETARRLGLPYPTITTWHRRGAVSAKGQVLVLRGARRLGIDLDPAVFFPAGLIAGDDVSPEQVKEACQ